MIFKSQEVNVNDICSLICQDISRYFPRYFSKEVKARVNQEVSQEEWKMNKERTPNNLITPI
jgi:hypothetical protein